MATKKEETKTEEQTNLRIELVRQMVTLATSGFGLVAALAWNSFIQELVNSYIKKWLPQGSGVISLFIYAIVVTIIAVLITYNLSLTLKRLETLRGKLERKKDNE